MARLFNSESLLINSVVVASPPPVSFSIWFNVDADSTSYGIMGLGGVESYHYSLLIFPASSKIGVMTQYAGSYPYVLSTTTYTAGVWNHACGVIAALNSRSIYLNGGGKATDTTNTAAPTISRTVIGDRGDLYGNSFDGILAEAAVWDVALTDDDATSLAKGISPLLIHPANLAAYWPIVGRTSPEIDVVGGFGMSLVGSPAAADHPRMMYPTRPRGIGLPAGGSPPAGSAARSFGVVIG